MHMMFSDIWNPFSVQTELPVLPPLKLYDATDGTVSKDSLKKTQTARAPISAQYRCSRTSWLCKTHSLDKDCNLLQHFGSRRLLSSRRRKEKHLARFDTQTKEGTRRAGLAGAEGTEREGDGIVFRGFTSPNTGLHEASVAGECGYCSL